MAEDMQIDLSRFRTGSIFWILLIAISLIGLLYLAIWAYHNNNIKALTVSLVFITMMIISLIISKLEILQLNLNFKKSAFWFSLSFFMFLTIATLIKNAEKDSVMSIFSIGRSTIFASIASELPVFWETAINNFTVPVAEELLWLFGIPLTIYWIMNVTAENTNMDWLSNPFLVLSLIIIVCSLTFALFHVGKLTLAFAIGAIIFRAIVTTFFWGDQLLDIPYITIFPSAAAGAHIGMNIGQDGFWYTIKIFTSETFGWILIVFLVIIFIASLDLVFEKLFNIGGVSDE